MPLIHYESSRRGALALLAILVFLLSGCTEAAETSVPADSPSSAASSAESEPSAAEPAQPEAASPMADGKLRTILDYNLNTSTVFCGDTVVYDGPGLAYTLADGRNDYFYIQSNVGEKYVFSLYDASGAEQIADFGGYLVGIFGNWLLATDYGTEEGVSQVYDLRTMERADPVLGRVGLAYQVGDDLLVVNTTDQMDVYSLDTFQLRESFPGWYGSPLSTWTSQTLPESAQDYLMMSCNDPDSGNGLYRLYNPVTGVSYDNVSNYLDGSYFSVVNGSNYEVYDFSTGEMVDSDWRSYDYYSDAVKIYRAGTTSLISAPAYGGTEEIQYAYLDSNSPYIYVQLLDGGHDLLDLSGNLLLHVVPDTDRMVTDIGGGMMSIYNFSGENGTAVYWPDGRERTYTEYNNIIRFYGMDGLLLGSYQIGNSYLYDLLDADGNLLMKGLKNYGAVDSDDFIYAEIGFRKGYITLDGEWLWSETTFQSTDAEPDYYW